MMAGLKANAGEEMWVGGVDEGPGPVPVLLLFERSLLESSSLEEAAALRTEPRM